jgi:putative ABC transport system permease protein
MSWRRELAKFRALFRRRKPADDLAEEIRAHLAMEEEENLDAGMPPEEARYAALRRFGNVVLTEERSREMWGWRSVETLWQDLRYGLRMLWKNPGFTAVAALTLALGIGVNTTIFSLVSSMLLRKPPVDDPDRLMMLLSRNPGAESPVEEANRLPVSPLDFLDWRAQATAFSGITAASLDEFTLSGGTEPERVSGAQVVANYFQVLGVPPVLGRAFLPGEDKPGHGKVVILREDLWERRFGADPLVLGRRVKVNGESCTVIGIMPNSFRRMWLFPAQFWTPLIFTPEELVPSARRNRFLNVFARLKPGVTRSQAQAEMSTIAQRVAANNPESDKGWNANVMTVQRYAIQESNSEAALLFLTVAVGFVLLIACSNIANLLLARNSNRQREFAIRTALGASRFRLARQLLTECLTLSLLGGGLGLAFAFWGLPLLRAAFNWNIYAVLTAQQMSIDGTVLVFTILVSMAAALVFGLAPILRITQRDPNSDLKESSQSATPGREHHRLQNLLVIAEIALSMILLVGAGLFVGLFVEEVHANRGMNPHDVLTASVSLSGADYKDPQRQVAFFQNVLSQLASFPQVQSTAVTSDLPFTFPGSARFAVEGRPMATTEKESTAGYFAVSPGYFAVAQIPLLAGREFTPFDNAHSAPVVIVNQAFAHEFLPREKPLGRRISISREGLPVALLNPSATSIIQPRWSEIVGVVGNVNEYLGQSVPRPHIFEPFLQRPDGAMSLMVRLRTPPDAFAASLRQAVWRVDKDQPVTNLKTMDRVVQDAAQGDDLMAEVMGALAAMALLMAAVGIYGLLSYLVGRRTHELGVRLALGARRGDVLMLVLRNSMSLVLGGAGVGFLVSLAMPRLVAAIFSNHQVHGAWILAGTPLIVILVGLGLCYFPARRASKVDPMVALRHE